MNRQNRSSGGGLARHGSHRLTAAAAALLWASPASATWSIVAADQETGQLVVASATCADISASFLHHLQAVIVPGRGAAAAQALVDVTHQDQRLIARELARGTDPAAIVGMLREGAAFPRRQFGIVDLMGRSAGATGDGNRAAAGDVQGIVPGTRITYSIQGNILESPAVLEGAVRTFVAAEGTLADRAMAGMEAADAAGGDARCDCPPDSEIPCDDRTSSIAYIALAESGAQVGELALYIPVSQPVRHGGPEWTRLHEGESFNPVRTLRMRYDRRRTSQAEDNPSREARP